jgi:hypothetical protein
MVMIVVLCSDHHSRNILSTLLAAKGWSPKTATIKARPEIFLEGGVIA